IPAFAGMTREAGSPTFLTMSSSTPEEAFEPVDIVVAAAEVGVVDEALMQGDRRFDPADHVFGQRPAQPHHAFLAGGSVDDKLGDEAVVERRHLVALVECTIDPDAEPARRMVLADPSRRRPKILRVL